MNCYSKSNVTARVCNASQPECGAYVTIQGPTGPMGPVESREMPDVPARSDPEAPPGPWGPVGRKGCVGMQDRRVTRG